MGVIYTIGHSTRGGEEFVDILTDAGVRQLVDVRRFSGSRRHPQFSADQLPALLKARGIDYVHEPALGGRRRPTEGSPNTYWQNDSFRAYADYLATEEFRAGLERLMALAGPAPTAIMCAEAVPWRCHRWLIADALTARGWKVVHLLGVGSRRAHHLNPAARVGDDGTLFYPAPSEQGSG